MNSPDFTQWSLPDLRRLHEDNLLKLNQLANLLGVDNTDTTQAARQDEQGELHRRDRDAQDVFADTVPAPQIDIEDLFGESVVENFSIFTVPQGQITSDLITKPQQGQQRQSARSNVRSRTKNTLDTLDTLDEDSLYST